MAQLVWALCCDTKSGFFFREEGAEGTRWVTDGAEQVLSRCPVCALCCDGTGELQGALPLPGLCFAAGISISAAGGFFPAHTVAASVFPW